MIVELFNILDSGQMKNAEKLENEENPVAVGLQVLLTFLNCSLQLFCLKLQIFNALLTVEQ